MSCVVIRPSSRAEWLDARKGGIGSSEVGTILGLNPFETPYQLWRRKKGLDGPKDESFAMRAGHYLEDAVSLFYRDETGKEIIGRSKGDWIIRDTERPWMQVSPDRTFWIPDRPKSERNKGILECKTTQMDVDAESVPQHWFCQLQYQLGVAELGQGALAWLVQGRKFGYRDFMFDGEFFGWMAGEVERFWKDNITGGLEPPPVNVDDVLLKSPGHVAGKTVTATEALVRDCARLRELKEEMAALDARKKEAEAEIKMAMGDAESLVSPQGAVTLATWKASKASVRFDEKRFAKENPGLYGKYQYEKPGARMFLLK